MEQMGHIVGPDGTGGVRVSAAVIDFSDSHEVYLLSKARLVPRLLFQFCLGPGLKYTTALSRARVGFAAFHSQCFSTERV
jgi:hypothetical protein